MFALLLLISAAGMADSSKAASFKKETNIYSYEIGWSAEAAAIPGLDAMLRKRFTESSGQLVGDATDAYREAKASKEGWYPETGYQLNWGFETAGQSNA